MIDAVKLLAALRGTLGVAVECAICKPGVDRSCWPAATWHDVPAEGRAIRVDWPTPPTDDQRQQAAGIVAAFLAGPTLAEVKAAAVQALHDAAIAFVQVRYADAIMTRFSLLLMQATFAGRANQKAYCQALCDWSDAVLRAYAIAVGRIQAATTVTDVQAVTIDFSPLAASDPGASLPAAAAITD